MRYLSTVCGTCVPGYFVPFSRVCADSTNSIVFSTGFSRVLRVGTRGASPALMLGMERDRWGPTVEETSLFVPERKRSRTITATNKCHFSDTSNAAGAGNTRASLNLSACGSSACPLSSPSRLPFFCGRFTDWKEPLPKEVRGAVGAGTLRFVYDAMECS